MISVLRTFQSSRIIRVYNIITVFLEDYVASFLLLLMRLWMAQIFWYSGLTKISSWSSTLYLFKYEYKVPIISSEIAAYLATAVELSTPIFLLIGFLTRLASFPMLILVAVIQFTYLHLTEHIYWAMLLSSLICFGAGKFSVDYLLSPRICCILTKNN